VAVGALHALGRLLPVPGEVPNVLVARSTQTRTQWIEANI